MPLRPQLFAQLPHELMHCLLTRLGQTLTPLLLSGNRKPSDCVHDIADVLVVQHGCQAQLCHVGAKADQNKL